MFSDVNECANNSGGCNQVCNNTDGSFHCLCNDGYTLSEDGRTCRDINECITNTHGCQQVCVNTEGGFRCECNTGYQLNDDSRTCTGIHLTGAAEPVWLGRFSLDHYFGLIEGEYLIILYIVSIVCRIFVRRNSAYLVHCCTILTCNCV